MQEILIWIVSITLLFSILWFVYKSNFWKEKWYQGQKDAIDKKFETHTQKVEQQLKDFIKNSSKMIQETEKLNKGVDSFSDMLKNNWKRGRFSEQLLEKQLSDVLGAQGIFWERQETQKDKKKPDIKIRLDSKKEVIIDSKFSLDNYKNSIKKDISEKEKEDFEKKFITNLKARATEVAKYLDEDDPNDYAIMYIPSETIFYWLINNKKHYNKFREFISKKRVLIVSPTLLWPILQNINITHQHIALNKYAKEIGNHIKNLTKETRSFRKIWNNQLQQDIDNLVQSKKDLNSKFKKIEKEFVNVEKSNYYVVEKEQQKEE